MPRTSKLSETHDFLTLYQHAVGHTEVPMVFHTWACLSMVAACLGDQVWHEKFRGKRLIPNLYTFLIGPSACGKDEAIDFASQFVEDIPHVNALDAKVTGASVTDLFNKLTVTKNSKGDEERVVLDTVPRVFLITPELSMTVGEGPVARDFIRRLTKWFTGGTRRFFESTRMYGEAYDGAPPVVNWLAGSIPEWLVESIPKSAIHGGFFARVVPVEGKYDPAFRVANPSDAVPRDFDQVITYLKRAARRISTLEGKFSFTDEALAVKDRWYNTRPAPDDPAHLPTWKRQDDLVRKLSMVLAVCDEGYDLQGTGRHVRHAIRLLEGLTTSLHHIIAYASQTVESAALEVVRDYIKLAGEIPHSALLKKVGHRGIHADQLSRLLVTLRQRKEVEQLATNSGARRYRWREAARVVL